MITLFINTAYKRLIIGIVRDNNILFYHDELIDTDLSSKIMPVINKGFNECILKPNDIDNIMVVNGPGSFTGIRVGATIAKVYAWSLNKKLIPISSLEVLASTKTSTDYVVPVIDARRDYVYAGIYDNNLNNLLPDSYIPYEKLISKLGNSSYTIVSDDEYKNSIKPDIDITLVVKNHLKDKGVVSHSLKPNYLKRTEAEEKLDNNDKRD